MELEPLHKKVIGLDIHQRQITACAIGENEDGTVMVEHRTFETFKRALRSLALWALDIAPDVVVMESTGVYWKSPYAALEHVGIIANVVNAKHVKNAPGRKTDIGDAQWLAVLARAGLLRASFVPPEKIRQLRLVARQRQKLVGMLAAEKNRLHKVLTDAGIRLSVVVSDINGVSARAMVEALIEGKAPMEVLKLASSRLKTSRKEILDALHGDLSENHLFVLNEVLEHIKDLETRIVRFGNQLLEGLDAEKTIIQLLQTIPGIDEIAAAMLLVEIGSDMDAFGSAERLASWAGMCPGNNESAGKRKSGRTRKGNPYLRRLLCECAHAARRTKCAFQSKYKALVVRRGHKRAIIAVAHKLLRISYFMISRGECYRDSTVNYEELSVKRNAPRWIKMLKKYGHTTQTV